MLAGNLRYLAANIQKEPASNPTNVACLHGIRFLEQALPVGGGNLLRLNQPLAGKNFNLRVSNHATVADLRQQATVGPYAVGMELSVQRR